MNLANRTFKDNKTGQIHKVMDSFENIAILENMDKMDVRKLMDTNLYTEQIDPGNFFNTQNAYDSLMEKIKTISTDNIIDADDIKSKIGGDLNPATNESAVVSWSEEDERAELARKYGASVNNISDTNKQNQAFAKLLGDDADLPPVQSVRVNNEPIVQNRQEVIQRVEVQDPILNMFKGVKRGVDFKMSVEISNKIPRIDFIEMMEDSYETSIIEYLADEFTNNLLRNPQLIKDMISDRIKQIVYGGETKVKPTKSSPKKESKPVVKSDSEVRTTPIKSGKSLGGKKKTLVNDLDTTDKMLEQIKSKTKKVIPPAPTPPEDRVLKEGSLPKKPKNHQD